MHNSIDEIYGAKNLERSFGIKFFLYDSAHIFDFKKIYLRTTEAELSKIT